MGYVLFKCGKIEIRKDFELFREMRGVTVWVIIWGYFLVGRIGV